MRRAIAIAALAALTVTAVAEAKREAGRCTITTYCPTCSGGRCADGSKPRIGVCAADKRYPLGTIIWVQGYGRLKVTDRGGAVHGRHFDVWRPRCPGPYADQKRNCWHGTGTRKNVRYEVLSTPRR